MPQSSPLPPFSAALTPIRKSAAPLRQQVLDELRQSIIAGRLNPGERLIERELISMMGVSRTVIREALRQLESEGLIAIIPNKGPVVRALTLEEARDLYSIRAVLEGLAARLFVENAADGEIQNLESALAAVGDAYDNGDPAHILDSKNSFYDALFQGARSATLSSMINMLHVRIWRWRALGLSHPKRSNRRSQESMTGLRVMMRAIRQRDAGLAERAIREEVMRAASEVTRLLANANAEPASTPKVS
ncbi:MAG TPA: GntR family transcriptional regulator [Candidatus Acidoferrum sp.]|jgi:DNA-binding GntR family transcriptional regulator